MLGSDLMRGAKNRIEDRDHPRTRRKGHPDHPVLTVRLSPRLFARQRHRFRYVWPPRVRSRRTRCICPARCPASSRGEEQPVAQSGAAPPRAQHPEL